MNSKETRCGIRAQVGRWVLMALCCIGALTGIARGQSTWFEFDPTGNLASQGGATGELPRIVRQPQPQVVAPGAGAAFSVVAAAADGLSYQWRFNGADLAGATADTFRIPVVSAGSEGQYSVVVSSVSGSVASAPAALMLDGDRDGLGDTWEIGRFGNLAQRASGDFDDDGVSNLDEFLEGTDPADPASVRFRLTVQSDGGHIAIRPSRFVFTNGEVVTLTATAFPPNTFHAWRGATNTSTERTIQLVMDGHKTVSAYLGSYDLVWTNTVSGRWDVASNWSPDFIPGTNDNVSIHRNVTVTIPGDAQVGGLSMGSGTVPTLNGSGTLTVTRDSAWLGGAMGGGGRLVVPSGVTLSLANATPVNLNSRTLEIRGTLRWTGGNINASSSVITNLPGGLVEMRGAGGLAYNGGLSRLDNAGIFRKTANPGVTTIAPSIAFNNHGTAVIEVGTLLLDGGGVNTGSIDVPSGTVLDLSGGTFNAAAGSTITGDGQLRCSGGTANLNGLINVTGTQTFNGAIVNLTGAYFATNNLVLLSAGTVNFNGVGLVQPATLNLSGATLGGGQTVTIPGVMNWTGGAMTGGGRTVIPAGATLNVANGVAIGLTSRTVENGGTMLWTGGNINVSSSVITNLPGATFEVRGPGALAYNGGSSRVDNAGIFRKTVNPGVTTIAPGIAFNNFASAVIEVGTLLLDGGGLNTGTIEVPAGTVLDLSGGTFNAAAGSTIAGDGQFRCSGGTANLNGLLNVTGTQTFNGAIANLTGTYLATNNLVVISSGTVNFNGAGLVRPTTLNLSGGTLGGGQTVTIAGVMNWTGGTMTGGGRTVIPAGATLNVANPAAIGLTSRTVENGGTMVWTGGNINTSASVITNLPGAVMEIRGAGGLAYNGGVSRLDNAGTFRKTANAGVTVIGGSIAFNNQSTAVIETGTLLLDGGGFNTGSIEVPAGTVLDLSGGTFNAAAGSTITGGGQFRCSGGTANLAGLLNVTGTHTFNGGIANLTGAYFATNNTVVLSSGTANFAGTGLVQPATLSQSGGTLGGGQAVTIQGVMNWTGGTMTGGGRTILPPGTSMNLANPLAVSLSTRTLENGGTILWTGAGITVNGGMITNRPGALFETRGAGGIVFGGGVSRVDNAGIFRKTTFPGTTTVGGGVPFNNFGTVEIRDGILQMGGGYSSAAAAVLECSIRGPIPGTNHGRLQVTGTVALNGALRVSLGESFIPATNDVFTLVTAGSRTGAFAGFAYPSNRVSMIVSNTPNSVIVRVSEVFVLPQPEFLPPLLTATNLQLSWTAATNLAYRLEYVTDLGLSNWTALAGDVLATNGIARRWDVPGASNRFYRVRVVP